MCEIKFSKFKLLVIICVKVEGRGLYSEGVTPTSYLFYKKVIGFLEGTQDDTIVFTIFIDIYFTEDKYIEFYFTLDGRITILTGLCSS